jgi:hypothetical protein
VVKQAPCQPTQQVWHGTCSLGMTRTRLWHGACSAAAMRERLSCSDATPAGPAPVTDPAMVQPARQPEQVAPPRATSGCHAGCSAAGSAPVTGPAGSASLWLVRRPQDEHESTRHARGGFASSRASRSRARPAVWAGTGPASPRRQLSLFRATPPTKNFSTRDEFSFSGTDPAQFGSQLHFTSTFTTADPGCYSWSVIVSRQTVYARRLRELIAHDLGGRCSQCGSTQDLEFHCIEPAGPAHHRAGLAARHQFYRREHFIKRNLQLLCKSCHKSKCRRRAVQKLNPPQDDRRLTIPITFF